MKKGLIFLVCFVFLVSMISAAPSIEETYEHVSETSAFIYWQSNESGHSYVEYGLATSFGSQTPMQGDNIMQNFGKTNVHYGFYTHAHYVRGLQHNTQYYYRRVIVDKNGIYHYGPTQTFTTQDYSGTRIEVPGSLSGTPYVLNQANANYVLTQDITVGGGAIQILADGITFDLDGHTITYNNVHDGTDGGNQGVYIRGANVKLLNGKIIQGAGNDRGNVGTSIGHNPVYFYPLSSEVNNEVAGVYMQWSGMQIGGLMFGTGGSGFRAHHNIFYDLGNGIDGFTGRETMVKSIWLPRAVYSTVDHNLIMRTRHTGISHYYGNGGNGLIYNNEIYTDSYATNAFGIYFTGGASDSEVYNNKFFATGYHAVSIAIMGGNDNINVHDNDIVMWATDADCRWTAESGPLYHCPMSSMNGVRVMWASPTNCQLYNNNITIYGESPGSYGRGLWLFQRTTPLGIDVHDNIITTYGDSNTVVCSIGANGYSDQDQYPFTYYNNTIQSDICNVRFTDEYGAARNTILENNTIRRLGNNPDYHPVSIGFWTENGDGHIFKDNILEGDVDLRDALWLGYTESGNTPLLDYLVEWTLNVNFVDGGGSPISGATVTVENSSGIVYTTTTSASTVSTVLPEFYNYHVADYTYGTANYAPYTITIDYAGWQYVETIPLNEITTLNIVYDPEAPSASNLECQVNGVWETCDSISYDDVINQIRIDCDDPDGVGIVAANFSLKNLYDNKSVLSGTQGTSGTPVNVVWDNNDYTIVDSGNFELVGTCVDVQSKIATQKSEWSVLWGTLQATYDLPTENPYQATNGVPFNYQTTLICVGGECGNVTATLDPFEDSGWDVIYQENFDTPGVINSGQTYGTDGWLTAETYNNGQIISANGYATFDTSSSFSDNALLRTTDILPDGYKVRAKVGFVNYELSNYNTTDYNDPLFNSHEGYYENGAYFLTLTDDVCTGAECLEQWWHFHRKAVIDVDNHLEWGTGTPVVHPTYMVYFGPDIDSAGGGNVIRSWDGSIWHTELWNWESAYTYQSDTWYYAEIEKMYGKLILRLYDENQNLITETDDVPLDLVNAMNDPTEYLYFGEPHIDDYKGDIRYDEITLLSHPNYDCGIDCQGANGCTNYNAGPVCSIPDAQCDGTNSIDDIYVDVNQRVLPGSQVSVGVDYDCWADVNGGSTDVVSIWYYNSTGWRRIGRWTEAAGQLTGCDSNAGDIDGSVNVTFTLDNVVGQHTIRAIENDQDVQWPEETSACPQPATSPDTPYGDFDDLVLTVSPYQAKNIVPFGSGSPFYTTTANPQNCTNMKGGDTCVTNWQVVPNSASGLYEFYVIYEPQNSDVSGINSILTGVNVTSAPSPYDVNFDGQVNVIDISLETFWQGKTSGNEPNWNWFDHLDLDGSNGVDWLDVIEVILRI